MRTIMKDQNGASAVEFALILPLLILVVFGIMELSLLLFNQQMLTNATREGTRLGIIVQLPRVTDQDIKNEIKNYAQKYLVTFGSGTLKDEDIVIPSGRCLIFGCDLNVVVTYEYKFLVLSTRIPQIWDGFGPITLTATSTMRME